MEPTFSDFGIAEHCTCGAPMALASNGSDTVVIYHAASPVQTINALPNQAWPREARAALKAAIDEVHARLQ